MSETPRYCFRPATLDDLPLLAGWVTRPHVRQWWGAGAVYDRESIKDQRVARWIVSYGDQPFAYMQDYTVHGWDQHHFAHLPKGARGIDQFIGQSGMMGAGHGSAFILQRVNALFDAGAPVVATDPHPDNARAIAVYKKIGFTIAGPPEQTPWGPIVPMLLTRPTQDAPRA